MFRLMFFFAFFSFAAFADTTSVATNRSMRILVYGDSNSWGWIAEPTGFPVLRQPNALRWAGIMSSFLGAGVQVEVNALSGRTVNLDSPDEALGGVQGNAFNGDKQLPMLLAQALPVDLVVVMLGTNDLRADYRRTPEQIAQAASQLALRVSTLSGGVATKYPAPRVLLVTPPPLGDTSATPLRNGFNEESRLKSKQLAAAFAKTCAQARLDCFDAGSVTPTSGVDGIHFTAQNHRALGRALALKVRSLLTGLNGADTSNNEGVLPHQKSGQADTP